MNTELKMETLQHFFQKNYAEVILKCLTDEMFDGYDSGIFIKNLNFCQGEKESIITQSISIINKRPISEVGEQLDDIIYDYEFNAEAHYIPLLRHSIIKAIMLMPDFNINPKLLESIDELLSDHVRCNIDASDYRKIRNHNLKLKLTTGYNDENISCIYTTRNIEEVVRISQEKKITLYETDRYNFIPYQKRTTNIGKAKTLPKRSKITLPCENINFSIVQ